MSTAVYKRTLVFILLICVLFIVSYANGAKPVESPTGNGGIFFDGDSGIELTDETISFSILSSGIIPKAKVVVDYNMRNTLDKDQSFNMLFIVLPLEREKLEGAFKVVLDNKDITGQSTYKAIEAPDNWSPSYNENLLEPYSKEVYDKYFIKNMKIINRDTHSN